MYYIPESLIERALGEEGLTEENLYREYSGRYMYGKRCFGIVCEREAEVIGFFLALHGIVQDEAPDYGVDPDLAFDLKEVMSRDSMGFSSIVYFPGFLVGDDPDNQEDDEDED